MCLAGYRRTIRRPSRLRQSHNRQLPAHVASLLLPYLDEVCRSIGLDSAGAFKYEVRRGNHQQHPQYIGYEEMGDLEPNGSEKQYIRHANDDLHEEN